MDMGLKKVDVFVKGPGSGRETAIRSLTASGLEVTSISDVTPRHTTVAVRPSVAASDRQVALPCVSVGATNRRAASSYLQDEPTQDNQGVI